MNPLFPKRYIATGGIAFLFVLGILMRLPTVPQPIDGQPAPAQLASDVAAAFLGGLRPTVANLVWVQAYSHWERRDAASLEQSVGWALRLEPRNCSFWLQAARMFAYDVPRWEARATLGPGFHPPEAIQPFRLAGAQQALEYLDAAAVFFPADAVLEVDRALLHLNATGDLEAAAAAFRAAWEAPGGPYFAGRLHGELLRRMGRSEDALAWYRFILPTLREDSPASQREAVLVRIADLERELDIAVGR